MTQSTLRKDYFRVIAAAVLALFLVPAATYAFVRYAQSKMDAEFIVAAEASIDSNARIGHADRNEAKLLLRNALPSRLCDSDAPALVELKHGICAEYSTPWQFNVVRKVALATLILSAIVVFLIVGLGTAAFVNRRAQFLSFTLGWRLLMPACAIQVVAQGAMLVWLSFWITAFFFKVYILKLIALIAIVAALAVFYAVVCIFKRLPSASVVEGVKISAEEAPALWERIRELAKRAKTSPPKQIIGGIDTNFFVTETPLQVGNEMLCGRSLFVSIPLLRHLSRDEADAVLAHELAHFGAGDTASSAALGPKLAQFDHYCGMMYSAGLTLLAYYVLRLYRVIFQLALSRESRAREFIADRVAAVLVTSQSIIQALLKVGAYARYRAEIERDLFEHAEQHHGVLGIGARVAEGLVPYASSRQFLYDMRAAAIPHPFDSHPSLRERMKNVGHEVPEDQFSQIVSAPPDATWIPDIPVADSIEHELWDVYEQRFSAAHEQQLAYRYAPANDDECAVVLRYFPPLTFPLRGSHLLQVTYEGIVLPKEARLVPWDSVKHLNYEDGFGGDVLTITHPEKGWFGSKTTKAKLSGARKHRAQIKAALGHYWQRHQIMRNYNQQDD